MTGVLIVDDEPLVRMGLRTILESADDIHVVGEAEDGAEVVEAIVLQRPEVVLMDVRMPRVDGLEATRRVNALPSPPRVVVLTTFDLDDHIFPAIQAGACGFLLKDTPPRELLQAIRVVAAGDAMLSPTVTRRLLNHFTSSAPADRTDLARRRLDVLTPREQEVLAEIATGRSNAEIGRTLYLTEATVKAHVSRVIAKLGVDNRIQVAILAHDAGLSG